MTGILPLDRRSMLERMAFLLGAAALPVEALAKPARRGARRFLNAPRMRLLSAVADTIIPKTDTPGALDAKVPAKFDALLVNWASPARRIELVGALTEIDALAIRQEKAGFAALSPEKRKALLTAHDLAALKTVPRKEKLTGMAAMMAGPAYANPRLCQAARADHQPLFLFGRGADQRADLRAYPRRLDALDQGNPRNPQYRRAGHVLSGDGKKCSMQS